MNELCIQWRSFDKSVTASTNYSRIIRSVSACTDCIRLICSLAAFAYYIRLAIPFTAYTTCILKAATLFSLHKTRESQRRSQSLYFYNTPKQNDVRVLDHPRSVRLCVSVSFSVCPYRSVIAQYDIGLMTCARSHSPHSHHDGILRCHDGILRCQLLHR